MKRRLPHDCIRFTLGLSLLVGLALTSLSCKAETKPEIAQPAQTDSPTIAGCQILPPDNP